MGFGRNEGEFTWAFREAVWDFEKYKTDISFQYSCNMCIMCIIQIGEPANRLSDEMKESYPDIPFERVY